MELPPSGLSLGYDLQLGDNFVVNLASNGLAVLDHG
jgi:hypothetical protein